MSSTLNPFGLQAAQYIGGKPRQATFVFPIASGTATSFFNGDVVALDDGLISALTTPSVTGGVAPTTVSTAVPLGVFIGVKYQPSSGAFVQQSYWASGTVTFGGLFAYATIAVDPAQVYNVQANGQLTSSLSSLPIGTTYNLLGMNAGSTTTGQSVGYLNYSSSLTESTEGNANQFMVLGLAPSNDQWGSNAWTDTYPIVQGVFNNAVLKAGQYSM